MERSDLWRSQDQSQEWMFQDVERSSSSSLQIQNVRRRSMLSLEEGGTFVSQEFYYFSSRHFQVQQQSGGDELF